MNDTYFCFNIFSYCGESRLEKGKNGLRESLAKWQVQSNGGQNYRGRSEDTGECADAGNVLKVVWIGHSNGLDGKRVMEHES